MEIQQSLQSGRPKADIAFYTAFLELSRERRLSVVLNSGKALQWAVLIPSSLMGFGLEPILLDAMAVNLTASILGLAFSLISVSYIFNSVTVFLNVADQLKHAIPEERTTDFSDVHHCVSEAVYVAEENIHMGDMDEATRRLYDGATKNALALALKMRYGWYRNGDNLYSLVNFTSMVLSIVALASAPMNAAIMTNLIIYVVVVGLSEITLILGCLLVALAPIICIGLIIFCCCCKRNPGDANSHINIPVKDASLADIVNAGGNCSICYQSINEKEKIYVLLCSDKHVFHCECLRHWTKVKSNCPICRQDIPMTGYLDPDQPPLSDQQPQDSQ